MHRWLARERWVARSGSAGTRPRFAAPDAPPAGRARARRQNRCVRVEAV